MKNIQSVITKIENKTFSINDLNSIRNFTPEEIIEITKIKDCSKRLFLSKSYITTFNEKNFKNACLIDNSIKSYFSRIWFEECINNSPKSIVSSYMIPNLFSSNLLSYVRNNIDENFLYKSDEFEKQIYEIYKYMKSNENYIIRLSYCLSEDITDHEILNNENLYRKEFSVLKDGFKKLDDLWQLFFLIIEDKDDQEDYIKKSKEITKNHQFIAYNFLPKIVYNQLESFFVDEDHFDLSDIINNNQQEDIQIIDKKIIEEKTEDDKKYLVFKTKNKRNLSLKNKPQKRGNAKKILLIVSILLISFITFLWFASSIFSDNHITSNKIVTQEKSVETEVDLNYKEQE
jgi:hypothetical protein